jgi:hypothetical protein
MGHRYDPSCYCFECCEHEDRLRERAKRDREVEVKHARRMREFQPELALELVRVDK